MGLLIETTLNLVSRYQFKDGSLIKRARFSEFAVTDSTT